VEVVHLVVAGHLHEAVGQRVGHVAAPEAAVVDEAVLGLYVQGVGAKLAACRPVPHWPVPCGVLDRLDALQQPLGLLRLAQVLYLLVYPSVGGNVVAPSNDLGHLLRVVHRVHGHNEEGGLDTVLVQQVQYPGDDARPPHVVALAEDPWHLGHVGVGAKEHVLGVQVEGEAGGAPGAARPNRCHGIFLTSGVKD